MRTVGVFAVLADPCRWLPVDDVAARAVADGVEACAHCRADTALGIS
ncbi:hypothetical protein [Streptomyces xantholiticus]|nr:hypothetical protein [Streptomyces xantholiticus]